MADNMFSKFTSRRPLLDELNQLARLNRQSLLIRLAPYGCRPGYLEILDVLARDDGRSQKELLADLSMEQPTLSKTLGRMERDGIICRTRRESDRRTSRISLTEHGYRLVSVAQTAQEELDSVVKNGLTINDIRYFRRILRQINSSLEEDGNTSVILLADILDE